MAKKRERKLTLTQQIMQTAIEKLAKYQNDITRKIYTRQFKLYVKFCRENFNCRSFEECKAHIQDYSDFLQEQNYTASTIHTYLAAVCVVFEINLGTIEKPVRRTVDGCERMLGFCFGKTVISEIRSFPVFIGES